jgi:hypothetical protein
MERVAGPSLKERLVDGPLPLNELRALGIQIGRALAAAHAQKIIHRDVKPANILAAGPGTWKLADFGVAHIPDSSLTMTGQFVGSPAYAPPEALVRGQCDAEGDVYGLGASLYQAAAGVWPRMEATTAGLLAPTRPIRELMPALPIEIADIIDRAVAVEAAHRPRAGDLADALAGATSVPGITSITTAVAPRAVSSPGASRPALSESTMGVGAATIRWQPWAAGAAAVLFIGLLAARCGSSKEGAQVPPSIGLGATLPQGPLRIETPPMRDGRAAKDWNKILDQIERGNFSGAKRKLWEWERKHGDGATPETEALRTQLDALGPDHAPSGDHDD